MGTWTHIKDIHVQNNILGFEFLFFNQLSICASEILSHHNSAKWILIKVKGGWGLTDVV